MRLTFKPLLYTKYVITEPATFSLQKIVNCVENADLNSFIKIEEQVLGSINTGLKPRQFLGALQINCQSRQNCPSGDFLKNLKLKVALYKVPLFCYLSVLKISCRAL